MPLQIEERKAKHRPARPALLALIGLFALASSLLVAATIAAWFPAPVTGGANVAPGTGRNAAASPAPSATPVASTLPAPAVGVAPNAVPNPSIPPAPPAASDVPVERTPVTAQDGAVRLATGDYAGGQARFYAYQAGDKAISFLLLKGSDGALRAAYDACAHCYPTRRGYHQEGDEIVCNSCGNRLTSLPTDIPPGGCGPAPLQMAAQGDSVVIQASDIEAGVRYF